MCRFSLKLALLQFNLLANTLYEQDIPHFIDLSDVLFDCKRAENTMGVSSLLREETPGCFLSGDCFCRSDHLSAFLTFKSSTSNTKWECGGMIPI